MDVDQNHVIAATGGLLSWPLIRWAYNFISKQSSVQTRLKALEAGQARIEGKLDALILSLVPHQGD